jgi:hypothetical protein
MNSIPFSRHSNASPENREVRRSSEVKKRIMGLAVHIASRIQDSSRKIAKGIEKK